MLKVLTKTNSWERPRHLKSLHTSCKSQQHATLGLGSDSWHATLGKVVILMVKIFKNKSRSMPSLEISRLTQEIFFAERQFSVFIMFL